MDEIDDEILRLLREDARASYSALGRAVGLGANAAAARVRRLEMDGTIRGYRVVVADEVLEGRAGIEAFVDVRLQPDRDSETFLAWARSAPGVRDAVHVTGPHDYLLHVVVRDTTALDRLLRSTKRDGGAAQTQTRLALR